MKITKRQLKKIIKEELEHMLDEQEQEPLSMKRARAKKYVRQALDPLERALDPYTALKKRVMKIYRSACKGGDQDACADLKKVEPKYGSMPPPAGIEGLPEPIPPKY